MEINRSVLLALIFALALPLGAVAQHPESPWPENVVSLNLRLGSVDASKYGVIVERDTEASAGYSRRILTPGPFAVYAGVSHPISMDGNLNFERRILDVDLRLGVLPWLSFTGSFNGVCAVNGWNNECDGHTAGRMTADISPNRFMTVSMGYDVYTRLAGTNLRQRTASTISVGYNYGF